MNTNNKTLENNVDPEQYDSHVLDYKYYKNEIRPLEKQLKNAEIKCVISKLLNLWSLTLYFPPCTAAVMLTEEYFKEHRLKPEEPAFWIYYVFAQTLLVIPSLICSYAYEDKIADLEHQIAHKIEEQNCT